MATRDAAAALGKAAELGTIQQGFLADLVIVNADPLTDLRNLRQIYRVVKGGLVYDPAELISALKQGGTALLSFRYIGDTLGYDRWHYVSETHEDLWLDHPWIGDDQGPRPSGEDL
jgi:hypothetical protein